MVSQMVRGYLHHDAARVAGAIILSFASLAGALFSFNAVGVPPWISVPSAFALAVAIGYLFGAQSRGRLR